MTEWESAPDIQLASVQHATSDALFLDETSRPIMHRQPAVTFYIT